MLSFDVNNRPLYRTIKKLIERRSPELKSIEKPMENIGCSMVAIKHHCEIQCVCYFWSPRSISRTSPTPLQNRDPKKLSLRVYIYIYDLGATWFDNGTGSAV